MRSGLQNPCAIPLLAIIVAALLSLTPMVCEAWENSTLAWYRASPVSVGSGLVVGVETRQKGTGKYLSDAVCDISNHSLHLTVLSEAPRLKETTRYLSSRFRATWQRVSQMGLIPLRSKRTTTSVNLVTEQRPLSVETLLPITPPPEQSHTSSSPTADSLDLLSVTLNQTLSSSEPTSVETKGVEAKSAGPVDGRSSFLAILVSLIVAIAWF